jgi:hypothetical protein
VARAPKSAASLTLKPHDPFELIRWLARSQSDPRKAVAELVQNSIDARATRISVSRQRIRGRLCLVVRDDGDGVIPELGRDEALRYLAEHVGHSRKANLSPAERVRQVGKYGVGLLGFWSVGRILELRTRVARSGLFALRLEEDSPDAQLLELPVPIDAADTYTEAVVVGVHDAALRALGGRRLSDYLAAELRGQILRSGVEIVVHDGVARGIAQKRFPVAPRRFSGEPLHLPEEVEVVGYPKLRVELYLARGSDRPAIQVACAGTRVADDLAELAALGLAEAPWVGRDLVGIVDFEGFKVPPGTRRGVMPDAGARAFVEAMERLAPLVGAELDRLETERRAAIDRDVVRELRRALRGLRRRLPQYDMPRVDGGAEPGPAETGEHDLDADAPPDVEAPLLPLGPLESVRIVPDPVEVPPGGERRARGIALDRDGRRLPDAQWSWRVVTGAFLGVRGEGPRPAIVAPADARLGAEGEIEAVARLAGREATATATVVVSEREDDSAGLGIPEPHLIDDPEGRWRSRMRGERWEVNAEHDDYRAVRGESRARVRYLLSLLAKELVLRTSGRAEVEPELESLVEILAHAERNLRGT